MSKLKEQILKDIRSGSRNSYLEHTSSYFSLLKEEHSRLRELNLEMVGAMKWVLHLWQAELSHGADFSEQVQLDDAWENVVKVLAKAEGV